MTVITASRPAGQRVSIRAHTITHALAAAGLVEEDHSFELRGEEPAGLDCSLALVLGYEVRAAAHREAVVYKEAQLAEQTGNGRGEPGLARTGVAHEQKVDQRVALDKWCVQEGVHSVSEAL